MLWLAGWGAAALASPSLTELISRIKPAVCPVGTYNPLDSPRFTFRGTGFIVGDGSRVATCWHVVGESAPNDAGTVKGTLAVQVPSIDGGYTVHEAVLAADDRARDLAVLRLKRSVAAALPLAPDAPVPEGTAVALIGFPIGGALGFRHVTHRGIVSAIVASDLPANRARLLQDARVARLREGSFEMLQLDATAYPGNSGGPLFDLADGRVVGVVNMVLLKGNRESALGQPTGISYAIPVRHLAELLAAR